LGTKIIKENNYQTYRRKRNLFLFLLIVPTILLFSSLITFYYLETILLDTLITIYLPLLLLDFGLIFIIQPRIALYSMYVDYSLLTKDKIEPIKTKRKLFTQNWIDTFTENGYVVSQNYPSHLLMYKFHKKLPEIVGSDKTLVFITIAKSPSFDFYSEEIDKAMQAVYLNNEQFQHVNKQITIQFKKFDTFSDEVVKEVEQAIIYKSGKQRLINLTVAYLEDEQSIYSLCPEKRFPNKFVYFACKEIKRLSFIKE